MWAKNERKWKVTICNCRQGSILEWRIDPSFIRHCASIDPRINLWETEAKWDFQRVIGSILGKQKLNVISNGVQDWSLQNKSWIPFTKGYKINLKIDPCDTTLMNISLGSILGLIFARHRIYTSFKPNETKSKSHQ